MKLSEILPDLSNCPEGLPPRAAFAEMVAACSSKASAFAMRGGATALASFAAARDLRRVGTNSESRCARESSWVS
eukprot:2106738-Prymnesium_polylepis.2